VAIVEHVKRHDDMMKEAKLAWNWLRRLSTYKSDYKNQNKLREHTLLTEEYELKKKYGFYPLINPKEELPYKNAPSEFWIAFGKLITGEYPFVSGVEYKTLDYTELDACEHPEKYRKYNYKSIPLPQRLSIEVDPKKPINFILKQIERYLRRVKNVYKIKDDRPRISNASVVYKAYVLRKLGFRGDVLKRKIQPLSEEYSLNESLTKRAARIVKKAKLIKTDKF